MTDARIIQLRRDLVAAQYSLGSLTALWGKPAEAARLRGNLFPAIRELESRAPGPLRTMASVCLLGASATRAEIDAAFPELGSGGAVQLGLLAEQEPGLYRAALSLNPVVVPVSSDRPRESAPALSAAPAPDATGETEAEWWILSDLDDALRQGPARPDHVMGVGGATRTLLAQVPPLSAERALDLGTGCGIVALYLLRLGAERVVATDISQRALDFADANAVLNGYEHRVEFRRGNLFEPVRDEAFDLIVSNPPFVITPRQESETARYDYRDGGMRGDALAATVVREAPGHLADDGSLVCLANWETPWGGHGLESVSGWVREAATVNEVALDAWVIERDRVEPIQYAETWARDGGARPGTPEHDALLSAWLRDFAERHVVSVGLGAIHLRRREFRSGSTPQEQTVIHAEQASGPLHTVGLAASIRKAFAQGADAARATDAEVLATTWVRAAAVWEERIYTPGAESPRSITLVTESPIARRVVADTLLAAAVGACDGDLTLRQIADALASILEVDAGAAADALLAGVRELTWLGMLATE